MCTSRSSTVLLTIYINKEEYQNFKGLFFDDKNLEDQNDHTYFLGGQK